MTNPAKHKAMMEKFSAAGDFAAAKRAAILALQSAPKDASIHAELAFYDFQLRNHQSAVKWGLKAISLEPGNLPALIALSATYGALDEREQVRKYGGMVLALRDGSIPRLGRERKTGAPRIAAKKKIVAFSLFGANSNIARRRSSMRRRSLLSIRAGSAVFT